VISRKFGSSFSLSVESQDRKHVNIDIKKIAGMAEKNFNIVLIVNVKNSAEDMVLYDLIKDFNP
jgi:hypothetical protein